MTGRRFVIETVVVLAVLSGFLFCAFSLAGIR